jgi:hypothetical protein
MGLIVVTQKLNSIWIQRSGLDHLNLRRFVCSFVFCVEGRQLKIRERRGTG